MATAQRYHGSSFVLAFALGIAAMATGCCGPMAFGPMGCNSCGRGGCTSGPIKSGCDCEGCGETYVDEWINHPPTCDPCDSCGNHNGQTCGACRPMFDGIKSLWGYRRDSGCEQAACGCGDSSCGGCETGGCSGGCSGGCQSCGGGSGEHYASGEMSSQMGNHYVDSSTAIPMPHRPTAAPRIVEAKPAIKPYEPQRTKQIFRPKGAVAGNAPRPSNY